MKLIIAGTRDFNIYSLLKEKVLHLTKDVNITHIISGGARGADSLGERFAREHDIEIIRKPAEWDKYGKSAGFRRNSEMADEGDLLIAFWDGKSKGTAHMIDLANEKGLKIRVVRYVCDPI